MIEKTTSDSVKVSNRTLKAIQSGKKKSLAEAFPEIAKEWHPTKNGELTPEMFTPGNKEKVWWKCEHGHEWEAYISRRTYTNSSCPYCSGHKVWCGYNDLATTHPDLTNEWHPTKNNDLTSEKVSAGSDKKVWWQCKYGHEWRATVSSRVNFKSGCPYCTGKKVLSGFNDLTTKKPELAKEWHPTKNGDLTPEMITTGSDKKIWWQCEYGHEWKTTVHHRASGTNCPYCKNKSTSRPEQTILFYVRKHIDLGAIHRFRDYGKEADVFIPKYNCIIEYDGYLHLDKEEKDKAKNKFFFDLGLKPYRIRENMLPKLNDGISTDFYYKSGDYEKLSKHISTLIFIITGKIVTININADFTEINNFIKYTKIKNSLAETHPDIAEEWHPSKNGTVTPEMVTSGSGWKIHWICKYGHEYESIIKNRTKGIGCPYCSGRYPISGKTDLKTIYPDIAKEWHPTKNEDKMPEDFTFRSNQKVWWQCSHCGHEYQRVIANQTKKDRTPRCPHCKTPILSCLAPESEIISKTA